MIEHEITLVEALPDQRYLTLIHGTITLYAEVLPLFVTLLKFILQEWPESYYHYIKYDQNRAHFDCILPLNLPISS